MFFSLLIVVDTLIVTVGEVDTLIVMLFVLYRVQLCCVELSCCVELCCCVVLRCVFQRCVVLCCVVM